MARVALAMWLAFAAGASGGEAATYRLEGGRVAVSAPHDWVPDRPPSTRDVVLRLPSPISGVPDRGTVAAVIVNFNLKGSFEESIQALNDIAIDQRLPSEPKASEDVLLLSREVKGRTVVVDRLVRRGGLSVHVRIGWPLLESYPSGWQRQLVAGVNQLLSTLTIDGRGLDMVGHLIVKSAEGDGTWREVIVAEE